MNGVIAELSALLDLAEGVAWTATLVFVRVGALVALMPGFGDQALPSRIKLAIVLAFTMVLTPILFDGIATSAPPPGAAALGGEALAGLILGIGLRLFLLALQTAAVIVAQASTLSQLFAGATPDPQPAVGNLLLVAGIALALAAGLHLRATELVILSYSLMPPGLYLSAGDAAGWSLDLVRQTFSLGFSLATPFVIASLVYNLALGAINRAMPQLMVSLVGAPALTLGALALLALAAPLMLAVWLAAFHAFLADPFQVPR